MYMLHGTHFQVSWSMRDTTPKFGLIERIAENQKHQDTSIHRLINWYCLCYKLMLWLGFHCCCLFSIWIFIHFALQSIVCIYVVWCGVVFLFFYIMSMIWMCICVSVVCRLPVAVFHWNKKKMKRDNEKSSLVVGCWWQHCGILKVNLSLSILHVFTNNGLRNYRLNFTFCGLISRVFVCFCSYNCLLKWFLQRIIFELVLKLYKLL